MQIYYRKAVSDRDRTLALGNLDEAMDCLQIDRFARIDHEGVSVGIAWSGVLFPRKPNGTAVWRPVNWYTNPPTGGIPAGGTNPDDREDWRVRQSGEYGKLEFG